MATAAFCAARASFAAPARADAARGRARLVRWRAATPRASPASPPFAEPSSTRIDARGVGAGVARLRRLSRRAVVDARHPLASFDEGDKRRDATERAPPDDAAEGETGEELLTDALFGDARGDARGDATATSSKMPKMTPETESGNQNKIRACRNQNPWWVAMLNTSLESHPGYVLLGFVLVDMGSALILLALITRLQIPVDGDFAFAYALSKSIRAPRLALDAVVAAKLAKVFPALAAVRVGPILDAGIELIDKLRTVFPPFSRLSSASKHSRKGDAPKSDVESASRRAAREAREMTDAYGLAYMTAKNIIGPVSIVLFYVLLKYGVDVRGALAFAGVGVKTGGAAAAAGKTAGALALASWVSTVFFPLVVLGAGFIGPKVGRGAEWVARGACRGGADAARRADAA